MKTKTIDIHKEINEMIESEKKLNEYPYNNDVIEKQYEELKNGIKFRIENNITDDWEQHYHCIDVLCENHKARIRDIENGICVIEELEQQITERFTEKDVEGLIKDREETIKFLKQQLTAKDEEIKKYKLEEFADACADLGMPKLSKHQLWQSLEEQHTRNMLLEKQLEQANQDKISFAIEKLENARDAIKNVPIDDTCYDEYGFQEGTRDDCVAIIDNQIKKIKGDVV